MASILVSAIDAAKINKGEIAAVKESPAVWGRKERLPNWLRLEVTGATADEIRGYLANLKTVLNYEIVAENASGWRVRVELNPAIVNLGVDPSLRLEAKNFILGDHGGNWSATQNAQTSNSLTVDIAKGQAYDLTQIRDDVDAWFRDALEGATGYKRYRFPSSTIDTAVTAGVALELASETDGNIPAEMTHQTITRSTALMLIEDRLD